MKWKSAAIKVGLGAVVYKVLQQNRRESLTEEMVQITAGSCGLGYLLAQEFARQGGQAKYVRVPFAAVGPMKVPDSLTDEQVLFLTDIFPTGYMAAENCNI